MYGNEDGSIPATFEILYMIGWKPHESQVRQVLWTVCFLLLVLLFLFVPITENKAKHSETPSPLLLLHQIQLQRRFFL